MDCVVCREFCELKGKTPPCDTCDQPVLLPENFIAWEIIKKVGVALFDGMGGCNFSVVDFVFKTYGLQGQDAFFMMDKVLTFVDCVKDRQGK